MVATSTLTLRLATEADLPALDALMTAAISDLQAPFLSPAQVAASFSIMGLDTCLVADRRTCRGVGRSRC